MKHDEQPLTAHGYGLFNVCSTGRALIFQVFLTISFMVIPLYVESLQFLLFPV